MSATIRRSLIAVFAFSALSATAEAGDWYGIGSSKMSCPWWRPCGPGETYGGNKFIPQVSRGIDGRSACQRHDDCYDTPGTRRKDCDRQFLRDMLDLCDEAGNPCGSRARAYMAYFAVRLLGGSSKRE